MARSGGTALFLLFFFFNRFRLVAYVETGWTFDGDFRGADASTTVK